MGEAFLHGHGGMAFHSISATLPLNIYLAGDSSNNGHAVITARIGNDTVRIYPSECVFSPAVVSAGTTSITISKTIQGVTRSCSVPVTVYPISSVFGNNSWASIAAAAYLGRACDLWQAGDEKTETIDGTEHTFRILGFNHNDLAEDDEMYSDPYYNKGRGKAAIALQFKTVAGTGVMNDTEMKTPGEVWNVCKMRTETLPALYAMFPTALKNIVRLVDTVYLAGAVGGSSSYLNVAEVTQDRLTLIDSVVESTSKLFPYRNTYITYPDEILLFFVDKLKGYELFEENGYIGITDAGDGWPEWSRAFTASTSYFSRDGYNAYALGPGPESTSSRANAMAPTTIKKYRPVFNI